MARHKKPAPSYVLHKQSGRGRLAWTDPLGVRQQKLLPGPFGSPESLTSKARLEFAAHPAGGATIAVTTTVGGAGRTFWDSRMSTAGGRTGILGTKTNRAASESSSGTSRNCTGTGR